MNIGIFGGSFDPIHMGHLHMALCAHRLCHLDQVWMIPAGHSPNKEETGMTDALHRLEMCKIAALPYDWLLVNRIEIDSEEKSYTYRTLEKLTDQYPREHFFFLMGGDSIDYFDQWEHPELISALCTILVIPRDDFTLDTLKPKLQIYRKRFGSKIEIVPCTRYPVSSSQIRRELSGGQLHSENFPPGVLEYIKEHHLYHLTNP